MRKYTPTNSIFTGNPQTGIHWEEWFIQSFGAERPSKSLNTPYDFIWKGERVDLKVCELYKRKMKRGKLLDPSKQSGVWVFNRNTMKDDVDTFICIALVDGKVHRIYKIPPDQFPRTGASIGFNKSKYDQYIVNLDEL